MGVLLSTWLLIEVARGGSPQMRWVAVGSLACGLVGFVEDWRGLSVRSRLAGQFLLTGAIAAGLYAELGVSILWSVPSAVVGVFYINSANFMDGVNGISSLHGMTLGGTAVVAGHLGQNPALSAFGAVVVGAFGGFLYWNFPKAAIFLGDSGSYILGALEFALAIWIWSTTGSIILAVAPMVVYSVDVVSTLIRRANRGDDVLAAHRDHIYQRVHQASNSHVAAATTVWVATDIMVVVAILSAKSWITPPQSAGLAASVCIAFLIVGQWASRTQNSRETVKRS